jgi:hypothetical protein
MKKFTFFKLALSAFVSVFLLAQSNSIFAQCTNSTAYGSGNAPTSGSVTLTTCAYAGEYSTIYSVVSGTTYQSSSSVSSDYITIRRDSYNGQAVAYGTTPITWTAPSSGTYYQHVNTNSSCGTQSVCRSNIITFISGSGPSAPDCGNTSLGNLSFSSCSPQNANYSAGTIPYWSFSATAGVTYNFSLGANTEDSYLRLYNSSYTLIASNDDNGPFVSGTPASLSWTCTTGGTYYISAARYSCANFTNSSYMKYWSTPVVYGSGSGNTITPTTSWQNQAYTNGSLYWYRFSATSGITYDFSLCGNSEDSYIRIFNTNWDIIQSYDDYGPHCSGSASASASWVAPSNAVYIISIYHYGCTAFYNSGNLEYRSVGGCTPPSNNDCANATHTNLVDGVTSTLTGTGYCSTPSLGTYKDVWVSFNVPCSGMSVKLDFCTSSPAHTNAYLNVFTDCSWGAFFGASNWDFTTCPDGNITLYWTGLAAGTYYYAILIDPTWETPYTVNILGNCPSPPSNDVCANAIGVISLPYTSSVISNTFATDDVPTSSCDGPYKNVWWTVTGICGTMTANTCTGNTNFDSEIAVYTGGCGSLTEVGCNDDFCGLQSSVTWESSEGTVYYISVGSYSGSSSTGNIELNVTSVPYTYSVAPTGATGTTNICNGESTALTVSGGTAGTGAITEWFTGSCGGTPAGTGNEITVSPTSTTTYYVRYNGTCNVTTCATATVTVNPLPAVTTQPSNSIITYGDPASFTVAASNGTSYQWEEYITSWNPINNGGIYSNVTTTTLNISKPTVAMSGYKYRCVVSGACSPAATSDGNATLTVSPKSLSVTATSGQYKYFGESDPVFTYGASGFVPGENESVLSGALSRNSGEPVGNYAITIGSLTAANYSISFTPADFEIKAAYVMEITTFLQGVYAGSGVMNTILRTAGQLPNNQPFNITPWSYAGTETLPSPLSADVVDWVLVELRSDVNTTLEKKAGLLYKDGSIRVSFSGSSTGGDYVVVWHRNHMPVMSAGKVNLPISGASYNLSSSGNLYGTNPAIFLDGSTYGMIAGDVTHNGVLHYSGPGNDRGAIIAKIAEIIGSGTTTNSVVTGGYWFADVNLNNEIKYIGTNDDRSVILTNLGALTGNSQTNAVYYSVVPGFGSKNQGSNNGPFDIQMSDYNQQLMVDILTHEPVVNGMVDNIQFTLAWKAGDTEIAELLNAFTSDFMLAPQGEAVEVDGLMHQVYVSVTPVELPEIFNEGDAVNVLSFENNTGQSLTGRLWIADNDFTTDNNAMYYVSVWGNDFTGMITSLATGLSEIPDQESVAIYPNPVVQGKVNVALNLTEEQQITISVSDMQGKIWLLENYSVNAGISVNILDLQGLYTGVYFVSISGVSISKVEKLIIK